MRQGWEVKKLGDVCDVFNGGTPNTKNKEFWDGKILWITPKDMGKLETVYVDNTERKITEAGLKNSSAKILPSNSVILSSRAPIGHLAINTKPITTNQGCKGLVPRNNLDTKYLFYFLKSSVQLLNDLGSGTTFKELSGSKLSEVEIPLTYFPEQQSIVSILDECFTAIDKAKANAEQNLKNAKELFESYLQGVFENGTWKKERIESVCAEIFAGGDAPKDNFSEEPNGKYKIPIYANAVKDKGLYGYTDFARVTNPSVTISARGSGTGHTELRTESYLPIVRLIVCIPDKTKITLEFLKFSIDNLEIMRSGSAIPQLTVPMIKDYSIPLPSIKEQQAIVYQLDALQVETQKLESVYQKKIANLVELKSSILQKAFSGELTEKSIV